MAVGRTDHTPGPWVVEPEADGGFAILGDDYEIAIVTPPDDDSEAIGSAVADANLIATAPDGLALARAILVYFGKGDLDPLLTTDIELRRQALAIIAKAERD